MIYYTLYSITSTTSKYAENHKQNFPFFSVLCTQHSKYNFPLPHVFPRPPFPLKREPTASAPRGDTLSTRIDRDNAFIMPLRLRGGYATECHAFSYYPSSSAFAFSPPCGSCSVFEVAHSVNKNALIKFSFIHNPNTVWISSHRVRYHHKVVSFSVSLRGATNVATWQSIGAICACRLDSHGHSAPSE